VGRRRRVATEGGGGDLTVNTPLRSMTLPRGNTSVNGSSAHPLLSPSPRGVSDGDTLQVGIYLSASVLLLCLVTMSLKPQPTKLYLYAHALTLLFPSLIGSPEAQPFPPPLYTAQPLAA
jgi:hypothetical protein